MIDKILNVNRAFMVALFMVALGMGNSGNAADAQSLQLLDAIRLTLQENPQFQIYKLREDSLAGEMQTASLAPALRVTSELENVLGTGDLKWMQGTELTLALSQVVEMGDKRAARTDVVSQRQSVLQAEQRILELDLLSEVTTQFVELAAAELQQQLLQRKTALAQDTLRQVTERVQAGRAPDADRARATADLALARLAEQSASYVQAATRVSLSSLWGELQPQFTTVEANLMQLQTLAPVQSMLVQLEENPAIQIYASETRLREAELREVRSRRRGDIEVMAGIRHLAELNDTAFLLQFSAPLGSKRRAAGATNTAQANLLRVDAEREVALLRMSVQLIRLDQQRLAALSKFNSLRDEVIPQLTLALQSTQEAFGSGRYSYLELSAAQKALLEAEESLIEAAASAHLLRVEIERLSGETLSSVNGGNTQ